MNLFYEGSDGTIIDFMSGPLAAQEPESLASSKWSYSTISGVNGLGKVKRFWKDTEEAKLKVSVLADDVEEFNSVMYQMHRTFDRDIRQMKPGKLWWNGFYKEVFAVTTENGAFEELMESVERTISFISVYPYWIRKSTFQYLSYTGVTGTLDYPLDYGFDYDQSEFIETITNDCIDAANFEIIFHGPCIDPDVTVGEHNYALYVTLEDGEYAVIDSKTKKITKYSIIGEPENIFHLRDKEHYIFEKIPEGNNSILRSKDLGVDISIFDERGEPDWI